MLLSVGISTAAAVEGHEQLAKHIKGGQARAAHRKKPDAPMFVRSSQPKYLVFGEKTCEGREAGDRQHGNKERDERHGHPSLESAHLAHVLFVMHGMDHAPRAEEQASFKKRVGHQMKNRRGVAPDTDADEHVAELADGGIGENFFYVVLRQRDAGRNQSG